MGKFVLVFSDGSLVLHEDQTDAAVRRLCHVANTRRILLLPNERCTLFGRDLVSCHRNNNGQLVKVWPL